MGRPNKQIVTDIRKVHTFWTENQAFGQCDIGEPSCYACGWWYGGEDRSDEFRGLEAVSLLRDQPARRWSDQILLCEQCRQEMPQTDNAYEAVSWALTHARWLPPGIHVGYDGVVSFLEPGEKPPAAPPIDEDTFAMKLGLYMEETRRLRSIWRRGVSREVEESINGYYANTK